MAKGNLFLGHARGKVGDVVFSRAYGKQITRALPSQVANPRTLGQNTQRCILATIAKAAAALTPIVDHSFANVTYGAESVRHFRKLNMDYLRNMVMSSGMLYNLTKKGGSFVPNYVKISEGGLPSFSFDSDAGENPAFAQSAEVFASGEAAITVQDFKRVYPYIQGGDQLTLVKVRKVNGSLLDGDALFAVAYDRMVLAPNALADDNFEIIGDDGIFSTSALDLTKTTNSGMLVAVQSGSGRLLGIPRDSSTNEDIYAVALILSRKVNNQWQRSTQYLELCEFTDTADNQAAIDSYGVTESLAEATEYLNQATEGEAQEGITGPYMNVRVLKGSVVLQNVTIQPGQQINLTTIEDTDLDIIAEAYGDTSNRIAYLNINEQVTFRPLSQGEGSYKAMAVEYHFDGDEQGAIYVNCVIGSQVTRAYLTIQPQP